MKKTKVMAWLLALAMTAQTFAGVSFTANAASDGMVAEENLSVNETAEPEKDKVLPGPNQYQYQKEELAAFCHFGPNTFNEIEWGENYGNRTPDQIFTLEPENDFDAETLIRTIKDAGFTKIIVTAKHHDGFCIWDSKWTDYDVAETSYHDASGQSDILAEISAACTAEDIDMGLYLSPWDIHDKSYGYYDAAGNALCGSNGQPLGGKTWEEVEELDVLDYNEYYNNQLEEILGNDKYGNNGHFVEVWMDGAKGSGANAQNYTFEKWFETIQKHEGKTGGYEDDCMLFGAQAYTTVRWIGNENGTADNETWSKSKVDYTNNTINSNTSGPHTKGFVDGNQWTVPEVDARITSGWFWGNNKKTPKELSALGNMYFSSVGHNAPLLLNIPPNNKGTVDQAILSRVTEFGNAIKDTFAENIAKGAKVYANEVRGNDIAFTPQNVLDGNDSTYWTVEKGTNTGVLELDLGGTKQFDVVSIEEAIQFGQRIGSFKVEYKNGTGEWKTFDQGATIGAKRLCRKSPVKADTLRITVTTAAKAEHPEPIISEVGVYRAAEGFALGNGLPEGLEIIDDREFEKSAGWTDETGDQYMEGTDTWKNAGGFATVRFTGTKAWIFGTIDPNHGTADVYVDDVKVKEINMYGAARKLQQVIFETDVLPEGEHSVKIVPTSKATGLDAACYIGAGKSMFDFDQTSYTVEEDTMAEFTVKRIGSTAGEASVDFAVNPGSAVQGDFDTEASGTIHFADGQDSAVAKVQIKRNTNKTGDLNFTIELENAKNGGFTGFNTPAKVTIRDYESTDHIYTAANPFKFPAETGKTNTMEAEYATELINSNDNDSDPNWPLSISTADWASNGKFVNCLAYKDYIKYAYTAKAGTYKAVVSYRSGSNTNKIAWSEADGKITAGSVSAGAPNTSQTHTAEFTLEVTESGAGVLVFTAPDTGKGPQIDKFDITAVELKVKEYAVTAEAGEHGKIEGPASVEEGEDAVYTITPDAGYTVKDVKVNGTSVGAVTSYTMENVMEDMTIEAEFEFSSYTEGNPFVFPTDGETKTLEAEHATELINSQDSDSDPNWPLSISTAAWASNGKFVNCLAYKDYVKYAYKAEPGIYKVVVSYRSGSNTNKIAWSEENGKITAGSVSAGAADGAGATHTAEFELEVKEAGAGVLVLTAPDTGKGPQIDKFEITAPEKVQSGYHVIVENGTIKDGEAEGYFEYNTKLTVEAEAERDGQVFAGWKVNGKLVSTEQTYTFYVGTDLTLTAVYEEVEVEAAAILQDIEVTPNASAGKSDMRYLAQLVIPEGCTLVNAGLVWSNKGLESKDELQILEDGTTTAGVKVTKISKISNTYQFSVTIKGVPTDTKVPGRIFAEIMDDNGQRYVYSEILTGTAK